MSVAMGLDLLPDRVLAKIVIRPDGCWEWTGYVDPQSGYGQVGVGARDEGSERPHRYVYTRLVGPIPDGHDLDHQCHNRDETCEGGPSCRHRRCCNPEHCQPATRRDNILAGRNRNREKTPTVHRATSTPRRAPMSSPTPEADSAESASETETPAAGLPAEADQPQALVGRWEFIDRSPTAEEVADLLARMADTWGVPYVDFIDYVQPLPSNKKIKVPHPERPNIQIDRKVEVWTLYMSVAGRVKMLERAAEEHGWRVDFEPEPNTPTGIPGMLQYDKEERGRIVYREYARITSADGPILGSKPGTAWVPTTGGRQAAGTNPFEKAETSARGRAIAAWGIGVLPGSGVASLEEMQGARDNARREQDAPPQQQENRSREELQSEAKMLVAKARQVHGMTDTQANELTAKRLSDMGVISVYDEEADVLDWNKPKAGHLAILIDDLRASIQAKQAEQFMEDGL